MPTRQQIHSRMIYLASEMVKLQNMPPNVREDWDNIPKNMTRRGWNEILNTADRACEQSRLWGIMLREAADWLMKLEVKG